MHLPFVSTRYILILCVLFSAFLQAGCDLIGLDRSGSRDTEVGAVASRVLVANGGNFGDQDGFITLYDPETGVSTPTGSLGGFLQGVYAGDDRVYALLNTFSTGRIEVFDRSTMTPVDRILDLPAPRAMVAADGTGYVSNLIFGGNGTVVPVDLGTLETSDPVDVGVVPEDLILLDGKLIVANNGNLGDGRALSVIDLSDRSVASMPVECDGPRDLFSNRIGELIVLCSGKTVYTEDFSEVLSTTSGTVLFMDAASGTLNGSIELDVQIGSTNGTRAGVLSTEKNELYVLSGDTNRIFRIDTAGRSITKTFELSAEGALIGLSGVAYESGTERLYVGRFPRSSAGPFPDFAASGTVVILDRAGNQVGSFTVGPAPSQIVLLNTP